MKLRLGRFLGRTCDGYSDEVRHGHRELGKPPGPRKISGPDFFVDVHLQRVAVASAKDPVDPDEQDVAVVAFHGRESQDGDASHEQGRLAEILLRNSALSRVVDHDGAEQEASEGPGQAEVGLEP